MTTKLSSATLSALPADVAVPAYKRSALKAGIVHFGVGNFHRAHQAVYLDELFNAGLDHDWAIVGAGVFDGEKKGRAVLEAQDWLTTVVEQDDGHMQARVTGAMIDFLVPGEAEAIVAQLAEPTIRIVSLTITEGGYFIDPASGKFNPTHPDIVADAEAPDSPRTVFGLILAGLRRRKAEGTPPFTVMSCDNIPHNGRVTSDAVHGLALLVRRGLRRLDQGQCRLSRTAWSTASPRPRPIASARSSPTISASRTTGRSSASPSGNGCWKTISPLGRPALEKVGVQFVKDVSPFELMKIRILNGGHATIAYPGGLMDIHFVHEAMQEPLIRGFLAKLESDEIMPIVPPVPGVVLSEYVDLIERRFSNPKIGDTIRRLCLDGSNRQPKFIIPTIADRLKAGQDVSGLALESALWCRYCFGTTDSGAVIEPNDPNWDRMTATAKNAKADPMAWLAMEDIYGDVGRSPDFRARFAHALSELWARGTRETLTRYLAGQL